MVVYEGDAYYQIGEVAKIVNRSALTIKNWYKAAEMIGMDKLPCPLPKYYVNIGGKGRTGTRFWKKKDVGILLYFRDNINRGMLKEFSRTRWGEYGEQLIEKANME